MRIVESPDPYKAVRGETDLFLAGGITNCPDWQAEMLKKLKGDIVVYNPRRANFPIDDPNAAKEQITWEYNRLKVAKEILFWFSRGSLNPIVLFGYGMWGLSKWSSKKIFIGVDPEYERKQDVYIQTELVRDDYRLIGNPPSLEIYESIDDITDRANLLNNG